MNSDDTWNISDIIFIEKQIAHQVNKAIPIMTRSRSAYHNGKTPILTILLTSDPGLSDISRSDILWRHENTQ